ncbi:MAG: sodium:solute symporter family protein [Lachnospiraceae bacterium]|nr:sodium:solute symporter family protein [Lachnospiraceae bacterium]
MLYGIILFIVILFCISIFDFFKVKSFQDFTVAGKNQGLMSVYLSLMTSMIGASATMGIAENVWSIGFSAFWWLGVGAIGLLLQGLFLSEKIREMDVNTLPDIADKTVGSEAKALLSVIIAVTWIGIIAAQLVSLSKLVDVVLGGANEELVIIIIAGMVILYTILGGQLSVVKTDVVQSGIIAAGVVSTLVYLFIFMGENNEIIFDNIVLLKDSFNGFDLINLFFITGGTYFLGPDIVSRNIISKDKKIAKKATILASISLAAFGVMLTLIGMWSLHNIPTLRGMNPLVYIIHNVIPTPIAILFCLALISTLLSSVDTCLVNAATIIEHDLLKKNKVWQIRVIIAVLGLLALIIALNRSDIIGLLLGAYSVYSPGIVCPLFVAIICYKKRRITKWLWYSAVIVGGIMGVLHSYLLIGPSYLPLIGMGISLVLSILSVLPNNSKE